MQDLCGLIRFNSNRATGVFALICMVASFLPNLVSIWWSIQSWTWRCIYLWCLSQNLAYFERITLSVLMFTYKVPSRTHYTHGWYTFYFLEQTDMPKSANENSKYWALLMIITWLLSQWSQECGAAKKGHQVYQLSLLVRKVDTPGGEIWYALSTPL